MKINKIEKKIIRYLYIFLILVSFFYCKFKKQRDKITTKNQKSGKENLKQRQIKNKRILKKINASLQKIEKEEQAKKEKEKQKKLRNKKAFESLKNKINKEIKNKTIIEEIFFNLDLERLYPNKNKLYAIENLIKQDDRLMICKAKDIRFTYLYRKISPIYRNYFDSKIKSRLSNLVTNKKEILKNLNAIKFIDKDLLDYNKDDSIKKDFNIFTNIGSFKNTFSHNKSKAFINLLKRIFKIKTEC